MNYMGNKTLMDVKKHQLGAGDGNRTVLCNLRLFYIKRK